MTSEGVAHIRAHLNGKKKELICSTHQMCILMLFN